MAAQKVLLLAEGTALARESLMCAVNLCQRTSASLLVVNAVDCPRDHTYWIEVHRRLVNERLEEAARNIDPLLKEARAQGVAVELVRQAGRMEALLRGVAEGLEGGLLAVIAGNPEPPKAASPTFCSEPFRRLSENIQALFGCPLVAVRAKR